MPDPALITPAPLSRQARAQARWAAMPGNFQGGILYLVAAIILIVMLALIKLVGERLHVTDLDQGRLSVVGGASLYPAVQNFLLACRAEGLGCVLTTLLCEREKQVRELLEIPEPWATSAFVPIGWPVGGGHGSLSRRPLEQVAFADRFGEPLFETQPEASK